MIIKKFVTGGLDGKPAMWVEDADGNVQRLARFDDENSYHTFLKGVEGGAFMPNKNAPKDLKVEEVVLPGKAE